MLPLRHSNFAMIDTRTRRTATIMNGNAMFTADKKVLRINISGSFFRFLRGEGGTCVIAEEEHSKGQQN